MASWPRIVELRGAQVVRFLGYTGDQIDAVVTTALDPELPSATPWFWRAGDVGKSSVGSRRQRC
jgi:hypothetical protein